MLIILSFFILMVWISSTMIIFHLQYFYNNYCWTQWFYGGFVYNHVSWGTSLTSQDFPLLTLATIDKIVLLLAYIWHSTTHQCIDSLFLQQSEVAKSWHRRQISIWTVGHMDPWTFTLWSVYFLWSAKGSAKGIFMQILDTTLTLQIITWVRLWLWSDCTRWEPSGELQL